MSQPFDDRHDDGPTPQPVPNPPSPSGGDQPFDDR